MNYITGMLVKVGTETVVETTHDSLREVKCLPVGHKVWIVPEAHVEQIDRQTEALKELVRKYEEKLGPAVVEELKKDGVKS